MYYSAFARKGSTSSCSSINQSSHLSFHVSWVETLEISELHKLHSQLKLKRKTHYKPSYTINAHTMVHGSKFPILSLKLASRMSRLR